MVMLFFGSYQSNTYWLGAMVFIALFCSAGLMLDMQLNRYVGFSGVLHGLFIIAVCDEMQRYKCRGIVLLGLIVGELSWSEECAAMPLS